MKWASQLFRWHLDLIPIAEAGGDADRPTGRQQRAQPHRASPQLPRHPDAGVVETDKATLKRLRNFAK